MCRGTYRFCDDSGRSLPYLALYTYIHCHLYNSAFRTKLFAGERTAASGGFETKERSMAKAPNGFRLLFQKPEMLLLQLGLVGLFALIVESAMFDWSAVYFESVVHVPKSLQIGFLVFMIMMATGRF